MKSKEYHFYVLNWDFNHRQIEQYDIIPYLVNVYKEKHKGKNGIRITNEEELRKFILDNAMYRWWARCEYEIIVSSWPSMHDTFDYAFELGTDSNINQHLAAVNNGGLKKEQQELLDNSSKQAYRLFAVPNDKFYGDGKRRQTLDEAEKIDVYYQVKMNIDTIVMILKNIIKYDGKL